MDNEIFSTSGKLLNNIADVANVATPKINLDEAETVTDDTLAAAKAVIDQVLLKCNEDPGQLMAPDFLAAFKTLRDKYPQDAASYRVKIKKAKPSGVPMGEIDKETSATAGGGNESAAAELIQMVMQKSKLFFDPRTERAYITTTVDGIDTTMALNGKQFVEYASYQYYKTSDKSVNEASLKQARFALSGIAKYEGEQRRIYLRVAEHNGSHFIFLADEDWRTVEVSSNGWRIVTDPPVKFWKPAAMQPLPIPQKGGNVDLIWDFVNIAKVDRPLVLAWLLESYRCETPKPVLSLSGLQGNAKSSTQNRLRELVDNNSVNLRAAPKTTQDIFVSAGCNWLVSYENLSHLSAPVQDALCTLATGGGFSARTLYSDDEETTIEAKRPVIINSIPYVVTAQDLTDRAICLELPRMNYREELEIIREWQKAKPAIFGGLLDLFVMTLKKLPSVKLTTPPRMADFSRLGEAMMQAQGHPAGEFVRLYRSNLNDGVHRAMECSPAAVALSELAKNYQEGETVFHGTVQSLLNKLTDYRRDSENWPRSAKGLADALRRQIPALNLLGIQVSIESSVKRIGNERGIPVTVKNQSGNIGNVGNVVSKLSAGKKNFDDSVRI